MSGDQVASLTKSLWARLLNLQEKKEKCGHVRETGGTKKRTRHPRARPVDVLQSNPGPDFHRRNESQSKGNDTSQHQTADHSKEGSAIPISAWCLSPYSTLHCLRVALHMRRVDCPFLGDSWKARLGNPTPHHLPPLPGTELVVSQPRTRETVKPASITRSRGKRQYTFPKRKRTQPAAAPRPASRSQDSTSHLHLGEARVQHGEGAVFTHRSQEGSARRQGGGRGR